MKLSFGITFLPQTASQTKRVNRVLNQYLRNYVNVYQRNWGENLNLTKFCYNFTMHLVTKMSLFELALVKETRKPMNLAIPMGRKEPSKEAMGWSKGMKNYTPKPKNSWSTLKNRMRNMSIEHEGTWNLKLGNMCG